ncbi:Uncharacterised protein [Chlamydia trachomatis]|nr:Uncharacterised protein [Chlamydia trachomatis]
MEAGLRWGRRGASSTLSEQRPRMNHPGVLQQETPHAMMLAHLDRQSHPKSHSQQMTSVPTSRHVPLIPE